MIAFKNAKIITMDPSQPTFTGSILVNGEMIQAVGHDLTIPESAMSIDCSGKWIVPGFIDGHTHIGLEEEIYSDVGDDVNESSHPVTPELKAADGINFMDLAFQDALRGGVTRSMCMPGSANVIGGQAVFLRHQVNSPQAMIYREPWGLKAALGENPKRVYKAKDKFPKTRMASASLLRENLQVARKLMEKQDIDEIEAYKKEAIFKVLKQEIPLLVHAHRADDIMTSLRIKDEFNIKLIIQHGTEAHLVASELVKRDVPVFLGPLLVNRAKVEMQAVSFKNATLLHQQGVKFALITDHPVIPIEHLRVCAALTVREGLDEMIALSAITCFPAELLGVDEELGSITPGKRADMVLYDGHPLDFRSHVEQVMVDGRLWRR